MPAMAKPPPPFDLPFALANFPTVIASLSSALSSAPTSAPDCAAP
jgi:hypothetical protein